MYIDIFSMHRSRLWWLPCIVRKLVKRKLPVLQQMRWLYYIFCLIHTLSHVSLHKGHESAGCSRQDATVVVATAELLGLGFPDLYIRRGYIIIRDRQYQSYLRISSLPLGCGCRHRWGRALWVQGSSSKVHDIPPLFLNVFRQQF
jgi:hypothetical protein